MTAKKVSYSGLRRLIKIAFDGDLEIYKYYDPNIKVTSLSEIVEDIMKKIKEYGEVNIYAVIVNKQEIGYFVSKEDHLISFALGAVYRVKEYLINFFALIKSRLGENFFTLLWVSNIRAIEYLLKQGMVIIFFKDNIIKLQCQ